MRDFCRFGIFVIGAVVLFATRIEAVGSERVTEILADAFGGSISRSAYEVSVATRSVGNENPEHALEWVRTSSVRRDHGRWRVITRDQETYRAGLAKNYDVEF